MFYLISYDISDPKRLNKTAKMMLNYGIRVQYSVFECILRTSEIAELKQRLLTIINPLEDSIRIYGLCRHCECNIQILGTGSVGRDPDFIIL